MRDRQLSRLRPEPVIQRALEQYIQWALRDAGLHNRPRAIPVYTVYSLRKSQSTRQAVHVSNRRLVTLSTRYRDAWRLTPSIESGQPNYGNENESYTQYTNRTFPVLTGFLICGPLVVVITMDSDPRIYPVLDSASSGKFIAQFDFSEFGQDVWNALAVAITVIRIRKTLIRLEEESNGDPMWVADDRLATHMTEEDA